MTPTQSLHVLGQVHMGHRLDTHYYRLFGFLAASEEYVKAHSKKPQSDIHILWALKWLKENNHLYRDFFVNFETMYRYQLQSVLVNSSLLDQQQISLDDLLQQEAIGFGGWYYGCSMDFLDHVKMWLFDVRGWYARDRHYSFYKFDLTAKLQLKVYAAKTVNVAQQTEKVTAEKVLAAERGEDPYAVYGREMPNCIPGSAQYWKSFGLNLIAMTQVWSARVDKIQDGRSLMSMTMLTVDLRCRPSIVDVDDDVDRRSSTSTVDH